MLSVLPETALLVQCADVTMVTTPLLLTRELSVSVVESITLSSPGPAAGSQLCSHILHILLFITTPSALFKMLLCSLSSVYSIHFKNILKGLRDFEWSGWADIMEPAQTPLPCWLAGFWLGRTMKQYNDTMFDVFWRIVQTAALIMTLCCHTRYISAHWQGDAEAWKGSPPNLLEPTELENKTLPKF